ncbi:hypothetical protein EOPP23_13985 [Endozoicomonas sp. OPT23]|uniref:serine/threonine-protein kinase n=1 Tax=Endozoicomonas sp. OPT23 TaxID=2072845 RepID=UPI00129BD3D3|nr:serine/threonine-protein kinase [Endozoicomonas sp. OPT23]MRI34101.1 hypothetical protein [Endozoicomonas sp. OPT23]
MDVFGIAANSYSPEKMDAPPKKLVGAQPFSYKKLPEAVELPATVFEQTKTESISGAGIDTREVTAVKGAKSAAIKSGVYRDRWAALEGLYGLKKGGIISSEGGFCDVFSCMSTENGDKYAVKYWKFKLRSSDTSTHEFMGLKKGEISALRVPEHENLVKTHAIVFQPKPFRTNEYILVKSQNELDALRAEPGQYELKLVVCDLIDGESLDKAMKPTSGKCYGSFSPETAIKAGFDLAKGMSHLHSSGVVHRDIKPENILYDGIRLKLIDFGLSKPLGGQDITKTSCGSPLYAAPELFSSDKYDHKLDVWSLGAVMLVLATGYVPGELSATGPKHKVKTPEMIKNVSNFVDMSDSQKKEFLNVHCKNMCIDYPGFADLLVLMFRKNCSLRISASDAVRHLEQLRRDPKAKELTPLDT